MRLIKVIFVLALVVVGFWEIRYRFISDAVEVSKPQISGYQIVQSKLGSIFTKAASIKADEAQAAYNRGDLSAGDNLAKEAFANLDHGACVAQRNCGNGLSSVSQSANVSAISSQSSIIVHDGDYENTGNKEFKVLKSDPSRGEYLFLLDVRVLNQELPVVPSMGETWTFSFSDCEACRVCAWGVHCVMGGSGQGGMPSGLSGSDRIKFNADDFPAQNARYQEAFASTGGGSLEIGNARTWVVADNAAGRPVSVGFNIRRSEADRAHGVGILKIKITK